jgi:hypothetical protein
VLAGVLLALGSAAAAASGATGVLLSGSAADPVGDAPAGADIRAFQASYSPTTGALMTTVTMAGRPSQSEITVIFGMRGATGACGGEGPSAVFTAASPNVAWLPPKSVRAFPINRMGPTASTTMSSGLTDRAYRGTWNCATAFTSRAIGSEPIDAAGPATLTTVPGGRVATTRGSRTILQLDHGYRYPGIRAHGRIPITVTCLRAPTRRCGGRLTLAQQNSHRPLGHARFMLTLGTSETIPVRVHLTPGLERLHELSTRVTVTAVHGPSASTVIIVKHGT